MVPVPVLIVRVVQLTAEKVVPVVTVALEIVVLVPVVLVVSEVAEEDVPVVVAEVKVMVVV